jgi:hypothetical protein
LALKGKLQTSLVQGSFAAAFCHRTFWSSYFRTVFSRIPERRLFAFCGPNFVFRATTEWQFPQ